MNLSELQSVIDKCDVAYYRTETLPIMTDAEYDALKRELRQLSPDDPRLTRVGLPYSEYEIGTKVPHKIPMGSLDNVDSGILGVATIYRDWCKKLEVTKLDIMMSLKVDGSSMVLNYENGFLISATTRGNGIVGEDITANAVLFSGVPTVLNQPITCSVRGEAVLHKSDFKQMMVGKSADELSNERNVGNGIIGREDGTNSDSIRFYAFNIVNSFHTTEKAKYSTMESLGFTTVPHSFATSTAEIEDFYNMILNIRNEMDFHIDGLVLVLNNVDHQQKFITDDLRSQLRPKYALAIKWPTQTVITRLWGVDVTVGHNRILAPTAELKRVRLGGIFCDSALLNNYDEIERLGIGVGCLVEVGLMGDIIPKVLRVIPEYKDEPTNLIRIQYPSIQEPAFCPACGSPTTRKNRGKDGAMTYCTNLDCDAAKIRRIIHWCGTSKKGIDIQGLGNSIIQALYKNNLVLDPADLYMLTPEVLSEVATSSGVRVGLSRATMIINNIQSKKVLPLHVFLGALGIDLLGERRAKLLIEAANGELNTLEQWLDVRNLLTLDIVGMRSPELALVHGGSAIRRAIIDGIDEYRPLISKLISVGVTPIPATTVQAGLRFQSSTGSVSDPEIAATKFTDKSEPAKPLANKSFCFTGTRSLMKEAEAAGAIIKDNISKGLDYLVQKSIDSESNKTQKARGYGTKIISLDILQAVLDGTAKLP